MGKARLIYLLLGQHKKTELSCLSVCLSVCLIMGDAFHAVKPLSQKNVLFSWRLPPHEPSSLPAGANYYTQPFYQTMLKFSIACSDKDLLLMRRQRERRRNWQAGQSGTHFAACQPANPAGFTPGKQGGLEPLCACWGNLSLSPFERFLQNWLRSCGAFFACGASGNRGVM